MIRILGCALSGVLVMAGAACSAFGLAPTATSTSTPAPTLTLTQTPSPTAPPTLTATPAPYVPPWPILRRGDGPQPEVFALQRLLRYHGLVVIADGRFGGQTLLAVKEMQVDLGEPVEGLVGPITWSALVEAVTLREGDSSEAVKGAEYLLNKFRNPASIDGELGATDVAALKVFENAVGLESDGVIDALTWQALVAFKPSAEPSLSYP